MARGGEGMGVEGVRLPGHLAQQLLPPPRARTLLMLRRRGCAESAAAP